MQEKELEKELSMDEKDVFETAEPVFDEEDTGMDIDGEEFNSEEFDDEEFGREEAEEQDFEETDENEENEEDVLERKVSVDNRNNKPLKIKIVGEIASSLLYIGAAVLITFFILHFVGQRTVVNGPSMMETLHNGDNIILDKISYRFHDPERFDIIVFPVENEEKNYIKRIIGLPGETVQIVDGFIHITGEDGKDYELEESYGNRIMFNDEGNYLTTEPVTLGEEEYFVLGDNRNNSIDSRRIGPINRDIIVGRAWVRIYPFEKMGKLK